MDAIAQRNTAWFKVAQDGASATISAGGAWILSAVPRLDTELRALRLPAVKKGTIDLSAIEGLDAGGAFLLHRTLKALARQGAAVEFAGVKDSFADLLRRIGEPHPPPAAVFAPERNQVTQLLSRVGEATIRAGRKTLLLISFLGQASTVIGRTIAQPWRLRGTSLVAHMEQTGLNAMPIVGLLSFLIGVVLAYQGADQLRRFGAEIFTVNLLAVSVLREIGILMTSIVIAGRSGSAFTAQIGTMKVNQEIDAMRTMGLDPMDLLVIPRIFALVFTLPLLVVYSDLLGLLGGGLMSLVILDISPIQFIKQLEAAVTNWTFFVGLVKAPVFALLIGLVGCYEGLNVRNSAASVGRQTTKAVVESIFMVIVFDAIFSILFSYLEI